MNNDKPAVSRTLLAYIVVADLALALGALGVLLWVAWH